MKVASWASWTLEHFLIHLSVCMCVCVWGGSTPPGRWGWKRVHRTTKTVDTENLDLDIAMAPWKRELKKKEEEDPSNLVASAGKAAHNKPGTRSSRRWMRWDSLPKNHSHQDSPQKCMGDLEWCARKGKSETWSELVHFAQMVPTELVWMNK